MTKETINELSKKTLASYIGKASKRAAMHAELGNEYANDMSRESDSDRRAKFKSKAAAHHRKSFKRLSGVEKAASKLAKEATEMDSQELLNAILEKNYEEATAIFAEDMSSMVRGVTQAFIEENFTGSDELNEEDIEDFIDSLTDEEIGDLVSDLGDDAVEEMAESMAEIIAYLGEEVEEGEEFELSEEDLQELSKKTLSSYVSRAGVDRDMSLQRGKKHDQRADDALVARNYRKNALEIDRAEDHYNRFHKRSNNIALANRKMKLAKEETDLQELSKKTLASYLYKAGKDQASHQAKYNAMYSKVGSGQDKFDDEQSGVPGAREIHNSLKAAREKAMDKLYSKGRKRAEGAHLALKKIAKD